MSAIAAFATAQIAGTAISAVGQRQAGKAEQAAFNMRALATEREGRQKEEASRLDLKRLLGRQRALYARAGVDLSTGSPLTVLTATAQQGEKEALRIRSGAKEEAGFLRFSGEQAKKAGRIGAVGTLLSGLGSAGTTAFATGK